MERIENSRTLRTSNVAVMIIFSFTCLALLDYFANDAKILKGIGRLYGTSKERIEVEPRFPLSEHYQIT